MLILMKVLEHWGKILDLLLNYYEENINHLLYLLFKYSQHLQIY